MALWRIDLADISHRYVDADSKEAAKEIVERQILASMNIVITKADAFLAKAYSDAGPIQRTRMLAAMDGLRSPRTTMNAKRARRKLERILQMEAASQEWRQRQLHNAPPIDVERLDQLVKSVEVTRIEGNLRRFEHHLRPDHLHGGDG